MNCAAQLQSEMEFEGAKWNALLMTSEQCSEVREAVSSYGKATPDKSPIRYEKLMLATSEQCSDIREAVSIGASDLRSVIEMASPVRYKKLTLATSEQGRDIRDLSWHSFSED
ncbi:hypothetical protein ACWPKS_05480 [Coraliomargarita sp. W4R72]